MDFVYVGDPLCSWCWGFAPSLRRLRDEHPEAFRYYLVVGGLRVGPNAQPLSPELRAYLARAWQQVASRSGQPFDHEQLRTASFLYDTEPACRAVVTARSLDPVRVFDYNEALQEAFYHRAMDPTREATFLEVAREQGFDDAVFADRFRSEAIAEETRGDFEISRAIGVMGFPATLVRYESKVSLVAGGFVPPEELLERVRPWID